MKQIKLLSSAMLLALTLTGCGQENNTSTNVAPSIVGVKGIQCVVNSTVDFLDGVAALDKEDGDITPKLNISVTPHVDVVDGFASFNIPGEYSVLYSVTDSEGRTSQKKSYVEVVSRKEYVNFALPNGFSYDASGNAVVEKCGMVNGEFVVKAKGHEVAEDVKVTRTFKLNTNLQYTFTYEIESQSQGKIRVLADSMECAELKVKEGLNTLVFKHIVVDPEDKKVDVDISLCLGGLAGDIDLKINKLETEYPQEEGKIVDLTENFSFAGRVIKRIENGIEGNCWAEADGKTAVLEITKAQENIWEGGMFINTGIELKEDVTYTVSFDISNDENKDFEVIIQRGQWDEYKFDVLYSPDGHQSADITPDNTSKGALWLYVQSGNQINRVRMSNLKVEEHLSSTGKDSYIIEDYAEFHSEGHECTFTSDLGNYKYVIGSFGASDYEQKVTSPTFFVNGSGGNYVLSFNAKASAPIECVVAAPVSGGWDPTLMWSKIVLSEKETNYTFFFNGNGADRDYTVVWQFGSTNNQKYANVEIEVSAVSISLRNVELDGK